MTSEQSPLSSVSGKRLRLFPKTSFTPLLLLFRIKPAALGFDSGFTGEKQTPYPSQRRQPTRAAATSHPFRCSSFPNRTRAMHWASVWGSRGNGAKSPLLRFRRQALPSAENFLRPLLLLFRIKPAVLGSGLGFTGDWFKVPSAPIPAPSSAFLGKTESRIPVCDTAFCFMAFCLIYGPSRVLSHGRQLLLFSFLSPFPPGTGASCPCA